MNPSSTGNKSAFVVATPGRSVCDDNARALYHHGMLRFIALGTRNGAKGVPPEFTRLKPAIGLTAYAAARLFSIRRAESIRFRLHPWFDRWVKKQLVPGDNILSSYGYVNDCFRWVRQNGGKTFLDGGNSHPDNYWTVLAEEHKRWNCSEPPIPRHQYERARAMMEDVDFVLSPSTWVTNSFLERGFKPAQILRNVYPTDISSFKPAAAPRPKDRPLTLVNTGALCLRKGTPYMLEGFRLVKRRHPSTRILLTRNVHANVESILAKYDDLAIEWSPGLGHAQLAERLRQADIFVLPSLEEGMARTTLEALACGLPTIVTPNTGVNDLIQPGQNGEIVPIRDPAAIAEAILKWADRILMGEGQQRFTFDTKILSFEHFEREFIGQLQSRGLA